MAGGLGERLADSLDAEVGSISGGVGERVDGVPGLPEPHDNANTKAAKADRLTPGVYNAATGGVKGRAN